VEGALQQAATGTKAAWDRLKSRLASHVGEGASPRVSGARDLCKDFVESIPQKEFQPIANELRRTVVGDPAADVITLLNRAKGLPSTFALNRILLWFTHRFISELLRSPTPLLQNNAHITRVIGLNTFVKTPLANAMGLRTGATHHWASMKPT